MGAQVMTDCIVLLLWCIFECDCWHASMLGCSTWLRRRLWGRPSHVGGPTLGSTARISWRHWATASTGASALCSCFLTQRLHQMEVEATVARVLASGWLLNDCRAGPAAHIGRLLQGSRLLLHSATMPSCAGWPQNCGTHHQQARFLTLHLAAVCLPPVLVCPTGASPQPPLRMPGLAWCGKPQCQADLLSCAAGPFWQKQPSRSAG